jgi:hypothetical protein
VLWCFFSFFLLISEYILQFFAGVSLSNRIDVEAAPIGTAPARRTKWVDVVTFSWH